ncbi:O-antigen ligase family protein [bacterium]|nr:O-antigen ligase family protein [bacterium]
MVCKVFFALLGSLFLGWDAALYSRFAPGNNLVWPFLAAFTLFGFALSLLRPKWAFGFLLFTSPWLVSIPLLATGGSTHPMHVFVLLAVLSGLCFREIFVKESFEPFPGQIGWLLWISVAVIGTYASVSRYAPEWVFSDGSFFSQIVNDKEWSRGKALTYITFNATQLIAGLMLVPFAFRLGNLEERKGGDALKLFFEMWLLFAAGCTLAIAAAFFQRHFSIELCANRSFYWMRMGRVNGTCQDPNALGVVLGLAFCFGLSFLSSFRREKGYLRLILMIVWLAVCALGINYSGSRSGFLAIVASLFLFTVGFFINTKKILRARPLVRLGIVALMLTVFFCGAGMYSMYLVKKADNILVGTTKSPALQRRLKKDIRSIRNSGSISRIFNDSRRQLYPRFAQLTAERTWPSGVGIGSFVVELPNFAKYEEENLRAPDNACNFYLQVKAESGLFGMLGVGLFIGGIFLAFAVSWIKLRGDEDELVRLWTVVSPLAVFALLLFLGVHQEVMEVNVSWHILLGLSLAYLAAKSRLLIPIHHEARAMALIGVILLAGASFVCYRNLNATDLNSERRRASIGVQGDEGFYGWENWHAQSKPWRWCGRNGVVCVKKMNNYASFDLISNFPKLGEDPQKVTVYVNGEAVTNVTLSAPGEPCKVTVATGYALPFDSVADQCVSFRLSCEKTWRPCDYGVPDDERTLGVAMSNIRWHKEKDPEGGFYGKETDPKGVVFSWTKAQAHFEYLGNRRDFKLKLRAGNPFLRYRPLSAAIYVNGHYLDTVVLGDKLWRLFEYDIPDDIPLRKTNLVELIASRQWMPRHYGFSDDRELGVAVALESWQPAVTNVICEVNK